MNTISESALDNSYESKINHISNHRNYIKENTQEFVDALTPNTDIFKEYINHTSVRMKSLDRRFINGNSTRHKLVWDLSSDQPDTSPISE